MYACYMCLNALICELSRAPIGPEERTDFGPLWCTFLGKVPILSKNSRTESVREGGEQALFLRSGGGHRR